MTLGTPSEGDLYPALPRSRRRRWRTVSVYAESSAVLAWLLDEEAASLVRRALSAAPMTVPSDLTLMNAIACFTELLRLASSPKLKSLTAVLISPRPPLSGMSVSVRTLFERARQPFPRDPIRTLDTIHLSSALVVRTAIAGLAVLSPDERIPGSVRRLGLTGCTLALAPQREAAAVCETSELCDRLV